MGVHRMRVSAIASLLLPLTISVASYADESGDPSLGQGGGNLPTVVVEAERPSGPSVSLTGAAVYGASAEDIESLPSGTQTPITDVLAQMPSVAIDQNQQIHIRNTEGPQFQYQINGFLVPLDINTNPPFISMLNTLFVDRLELRVGVLPARYGYATGGVVDVESKDGCRQRGGELGVYGGQRGTISPSFEYAACNGALASYVSARESWSNTAFSSATAGPTPIHDWQKSEQALGFWTYSLDRDTRMSLLLAATVSDNELPNVPGLAPAYRLAGAASVPSSAGIDSTLNFRDYLLMGTIKSAPSAALELQLGYTAHFIAQQFNPDSVGELIYQGVASQATHQDRDNAIEGDLRYVDGGHTVGAGFYVGSYEVQYSDNSLAFPADPDGQQTSNVPVRVLTASAATNVVSSVYVGDLWQPSPHASVDIGVRGDDLTGYTHAQQLSPRLNFSVRPNSASTLHAGFARYLQVPGFLGIAPNTPSAFAGTTAAGPPGATLPLAEDDYEYDAGAVVKATEHLTLSVDGYYERTIRYLDTGQFGVVPIFAPFNYGHGHLWGTELAARYKTGDLTAYANFTVGKNWQQGVVTGQFNFPPAELAYINAHPIILDHQPIRGASAGVSYNPRPYLLSADALYSSGLATGFADTQWMPELLQINASAERTMPVTGLSSLSIRLSVLNILDRVDQIRSAEGIGIFQAAYAPRRTLYGTITLRF